MREESGVGFIGVGIFSLECCGGGGFDHGECGYYIAKGVGDLKAGVLALLDVRFGEGAVMTYQRHHAHVSDDSSE